jgi:predicted transcriptional regulator
MFNIWPVKHRRSNVQIISEILKASLFREAGKTEILALVNVNSIQLQKYLQRLLALSLLDARIKKDSRISYRTTEKGRKLLSQIESAQELLQRNRRFST